MSNVLKYNNYIAKVEFSAEDGLLYGKVEGISDLVSFESESAANIEQAFHEAVDDYIQFCKEVGKSPNKSYSGTFNVRVSSDIHRKASYLAMEMNISLNQLVEKALTAFTSQSDKPIITSNIVMLFPNVSEQTDNMSRQVLDIWKRNAPEKLPLFSASSAYKSN